MRQLRVQVEGLSEEQARDVLVVLASRRLVALHQAAPLDDEPEDDPAELMEAREQLRRGETVSMADARRELFGDALTDRTVQALEITDRRP